MSFFRSALAWFIGLLAAGLLLFLVVLGVGSGLSGKSEAPDVKSNSVLKVSLSGQLLERNSSDVFQKVFNKGVTRNALNQLVESIKYAKSDSDIDGIYLELGVFSAGAASVEALRNALEDFKTSKKFIYAYGEIITEKSYYLASVADSIFLNPVGGMEWNGLNSNPMFYKGGLEKLEIEPQVFKVGTFKSAVEPFILKEMSPANREQISTILNDLWNHMLGKIASSRRVNKDTLDNLASRFDVELAKSALKYKLVDGLIYEDEVFELLKKRTKLKADDKVRFVKAGEYFQIAKDNRKSSSNKVAVVYAVGDIVSGKGDDDTIGSESLVAELRKARLDDDVKAVVLRVNSPGGSALASDVIAREIELIKKKKAIVASYGDVAASGGYYISTLCDKIVAEPMTITGSIGVFGLMFNTQKMFNNKLGITFDRVYSNTNQYADLGDPNRPMSPFEIQKIQMGVNQVYSEFIQTVVKGRKGAGLADSVAVDAVAQGRVWSGIRAKELKLVDELGGLETAIQIAAKKAGIDKDYEIVDYPAEKEFLAGIFGDEDSEEAQATLVEEAVVKHLSPELAKTVRLFKTLQTDPRGIYVRDPYVWDIE